MKPSDVERQHVATKSAKTTKLYSSLSDQKHGKSTDIRERWQQGENMDIRANC